MPYKFTGKELDTSSNLYFYESRYYHAIFGRFVSPDTIVPDLHDPQELNRYAYALNNPLYYTDPTGHCPWCIVIAIGVVAGAVSSGIQSDWDLQATLLGGVIGGASAAVGYGVFTPASAAFAGLGNIGSGIAGGIVAGAAAGGTSGILANMAGYNVNIGLVIASGAAAGGIVGGAGAQFGGLGAFVAAPAAGASAAAISGADPGMGAAIAAATAAFALGVQQAYKLSTVAQNSEGSPSSMATRASYDPSKGGCAGECRGVSGHVLSRPDTTTLRVPSDPYAFNVLVNNPKGASLSVTFTTPYASTQITSFRTMGGVPFSSNTTINVNAFTFGLERISLNYRSDVFIHVYGESGHPIGIFDVPFDYQRSQIGVTSH